MFDKYINKPLDLDTVDNDMMDIAISNGISNAKSINHFGVNGLLRKHHGNGFYTGLYYYGDKMNCVAIAFSIQLNKKDVNKSSVMVYRARLIKDNKLIIDKKG